MTKEKIERNLELTIRRDRDKLSFGKLGNIYRLARVNAWKIYHRTKKKHKQRLKELEPSMYG
jgi:hypothetical protein